MSAAGTSAAAVGAAVADRTHEAEPMPAGGWGELPLEVFEIIGEKLDTRDR